MKSSKYNYIVKDDDYLYCFNALTRFFFKLKKDKYALLTRILEEPEDSLEHLLPLFYKQLKAGGFIIQDNFNELDFIRKSHLAAVNSSQLSLTILPTMNCNFHCWYCYENHHKSKMSVEVVQAIENYISRQLASNEITSLNLSWFGGEPFLYFHEIMLPLLKFAQKECEKHNKPFGSSSTTNAFLITEDIAKDLKEFSMHSLQITLDGERNYHNTVRHDRNKSSFDTILNNISNICFANPNVIITLRINYDNKNLEPEKIIRQISEIIPTNIRKQIRFLLRKVWQIKPFDGEIEKRVNFINKLYEEGYSYYFDAELNSGFIPCYASCKNMLLITHDGVVGKCTSRSNFTDYAIGKITPNGKIEWKKEAINELYSMPFFENKNCLECKQLPICMGECPTIINSEGVVDYDSEHCRKKIDDKELEQLILAYCKYNIN